MQHLWRELRQQLDDKESSNVTEVELRLTGLMTSPGPEVAKAKLGQYLQEARRLRQRNQLQEAAVIILVCAEYYWRKHQLTRSAGLLLEACDLFYLLNNPNASQRCLDGALDLSQKQAPLAWWEREIIGNIFLLTAAITLISDPSVLSKQLRQFRDRLPKKLQRRVSREDGYRVTIALRRAQKQHSLSPIEALDAKATYRTRSEFTTLYEYVMGMAERYSLVRDALTTFRYETQQED